MSNTFRGRVQFTPLLFPAIKPTLLTLSREHEIDLDTLADAAGVSSTDVYVMGIGGRVQKAFAVNVLKAFSELTRKEYSFDNVSVSVKED